MTDQISFLPMLEPRDTCRTNKAKITDMAGLTEERDGLISERDNIDARR